ncbi:hypothetical protein FA15DRAFT_701772 [Coprinopsis marcescibilis]|uniref:DUF6534 domain-containing protein n=1 Tax=Coprinopsis marcescibilis TaxID=230819 RepID=A0A5C3L4R6_COPMA|nr:hypothetical protein FA15DRAFT_701772 [Coprinopsis marcescibilis]
MVTPQLLGLTYHSTLGAASVGFSISCAVFGMLTTQVIIYYQRYFEDTNGYKILVGLLWSLELMDQIFIGYAVYYYSITHYGDPSVLLNEDIVWPLLAQVIVGNVVGGIVKCCFALRVWRFSHRNYLIAVPIFFLILAQSGLAVVYCVRGFQLNKLIYANQLRVIASVSLAAGMVTDVAIAVALCVLLRKLRTGFKKSDTLITTLTVYAINTGALTGAVALVTLIMYNISPNAFYFMSTYFTLGKLYAISLLCTLNTRRSIRGKGTDQQDPPSVNTSAARNTLFLVSPTRSKGGQPSSPHLFNSKLEPNVEVGIRQEVSITSDNEQHVEFSRARVVSDGSHRPSQYPRRPKPGSF